MKLSINLFSTLDAVSQAPGGVEEDPSGGFSRGGWLMGVFDDGCGETVDGWFARCDAVLLGRRTFDMMSGHWPLVTDPEDAVAAKLNHGPKYVVTSSAVDGAWADTTTVLGGDFLDRIRELKEAGGDGELQLHGSIRLARTLHEVGLVDIYRFLIAPVVVGRGKGIFTDDSPAHTMTVTDSRITENGVVALEMTAGELKQGLAVVEAGKDAIR